MASIISQKIVPVLWFDNNAVEAVKYYTSIFKKSKIIQLHPLVSTFELEGLRLMALNGGPNFKFTEAISLQISCKTQEEVDYYWDALCQGGKPGQCGWLKDKYGLSWQIVPAIVNELMSGPDPKKWDKVMQAILKMTKLDIETLRQANNS